MTDADELSFTAFADLCRLCSLKNGTRINIFDKEGEERQILYKIRSCLATSVSPNIISFKLDLYCEVNWNVDILI